MKHILTDRNSGAIVTDPSTGKVVEVDTQPGMATTNSDCECCPPETGQKFCPPLPCGFSFNLELIGDCDGCPSCPYDYHPPHEPPPYQKQWVTPNPNVGTDYVSGSVFANGCTLYAKAVVGGYGGPPYNYLAQSGATGFKSIGKTKFFYGNNCNGTGPWPRSEVYEYFVQGFAEVKQTPNGQTDPSTGYEVCPATITAYLSGFAKPEQSANLGYGQVAGHGAPPYCPDVNGNARQLTPLSNLPSCHEVPFNTSTGYIVIESPATVPETTYDTDGNPQQSQVAYCPRWRLIVTALSGTGNCPDTDPYGPPTPKTIPPDPPPTGTTPTPPPTPPATPPDPTPSPSPTPTPPGTKPQPNPDPIGTPTPLPTPNPPGGGGGVIVSPPTPPGQQPVPVTPPSPVPGCSDLLSGIPVASGGDPTAAFDGNYATAFVSPQQQGWVGVVFDTPQVITSIGYVGRAGSSGAMIGGHFEGSLDSTFGQTTTLANVTVASSTAMTFLGITDGTQYKAVRFVAGNYCPVAELAFYGCEGTGGTVSPTPTPPTDQSGVCDSGNPCPACSGTTPTEYVIRFDAVTIAGFTCGTERYESSGSLNFPTTGQTFTAAQVNPCGYTLTVPDSPVRVRRYGNAGGYGAGTDVTGPLVVNIQISAFSFRVWARMLTTNGAAIVLYDGTASGTLPCDTGLQEIQNSVQVQTCGTVSDPASAWFLGIGGSATVYACSVPTTPGGGCDGVTVVEPGDFTYGTGFVVEPDDGGVVDSGPLGIDLGTAGGSAVALRFNGGSDDAAVLVPVNETVTGYLNGDQRTIGLPANAVILASSGGSIGRSQLWTDGTHGVLLAENEDYTTQYADLSGAGFNVVQNQSDSEGGFWSVPMSLLRAASVVNGQAACFRLVYVPGGAGNFSAGPASVVPGLSVSRPVTVQQQRGRTFHELWADVHSIADPTPEWWGKVLADLGCGDCRRHTIEYVRAHPIPFGDVAAFGVWAVGFHDAVNVRIGKPVWGG